MVRDILKNGYGMMDTQVRKLYLLRVEGLMRGSERRLLLNLFLHDGPGKKGQWEKGVLHKGPDSKYFWFCRPCGFRGNCSDTAAHNHQ